MVISLPLLALIVAIYALVQSVFGVGLLVFGTPTLLLLGVPFQQALGWLLPCSMMVNSLQLLGQWREVTLKGKFVVYCLPLVVVGLFLALTHQKPANIKLEIGLLLLFTAFIRLSDPLHQKLKSVFAGHVRGMMLLLGAIHGLTNMGGGILTILVSSLYTDKKVIRANIAFGYLMMAMSQCIVLALLQPGVFGWKSGFLAAIAGAMYLAFGNRVFEAASSRSYQVALTGLILLFGAVLLQT